MESKGLPRWLMVENPPANAGAEGDVDSTPGSGRSPGGGNGKSIPIILPEKSQGQRSLAVYSPWGRKESDTTERVGTPSHSTSK